MAEEIKVRILKKTKEGRGANLDTSAESKVKKTSLSKKNRKEEHESDTRRRVILLAVKIAFFVLICYIVFFVVFGVTRMKDNGMYPAIRDGDMLMYYRIESNYGSGDVVVVDVDGEERVMRIIASGGQEVDINDEDGLLVDGQPSNFQAFYETHRAGEYRFKYPYKVYNSILNLQMLDSRENESKGKLELDKWVEICCSEKDTKERFLKSHLIPNIDLSISNFPDFIEERKKMLKIELNNILNGNV